MTLEEARRALSNLKVGENLVLLSLQINVSATAQRCRDNTVRYHVLALNARRQSMQPHHENGADTHTIVTQRTNCSPAFGCSDWPAHLGLLSRLLL